MRAAGKIVANHKEITIEKAFLAYEKKMAEILRDNAKYTAIIITALRA